MRQYGQVGPAKISLEKSYRRRYMTEMPTARAQVLIMALAVGLAVAWTSRRAIIEQVAFGGRGSWLAPPPVVPEELPSDPGPTPVPRARSESIMEAPSGFEPAEGRDLPPSSDATRHDANFGAVASHSTAVDSKDSGEGARPPSVATLSLNEAAAIPDGPVQALPHSSTPASGSAPEIFAFSAEDCSKIGHRIWRNEGAGTVEGLTSWNKGEAFASLGIGHFLWFPEGSDAIFEESFPDLLDFAAEKGAASEIPGWIRGSRKATKWPPCPWPDRRAFLADFDGEPMRELRSFLESTVPLQTEFLLERFDAAFPKILASAGTSAKHVENQFSKLSRTPEGAFAMIDYVNFKGEGTRQEERYNGEGWGLLQVLQEMESEGEPDATPVEAFSRSADRILTRRADNNPSDTKWLGGWRSRVADYRNPF